MPFSERIKERLREAGISIKIDWIRGRGYIDWFSPAIWLILGIKGSGKSALIEALALRFEKIIDLFASRDNENLCWLRDTSPIDDAILVIGDNCDIDCSWPTVHVSELQLSHITDHEITLTCDGFYSSQDARFRGVSKIINQLWARRGFDYPIYIGIREASSFLYSRIKQEGVNMKIAKADFIYQMREMRHLGYTMGVDTIRWTSVDKEMRDLADYLIIKRMGRNGLPKDIRYFYRYGSVPSISLMSPDRFMVQSAWPIGIGSSGLPSFHKEKGVDLMGELGLFPEFGEELKESTSQQVGDAQHMEIIKLYHSGTSMANIANKVHRSTYTIHSHIKKHNDEIANHGYCPICQKGNGDMFDAPVIVA